MVQHQLAQLRGQWMDEGLWSLETPDASWRMRVSAGEVSFSTDSALRSQLVMMVELCWLSIAQAQLILEQGLPLEAAFLPMLLPQQLRALQLRWFRNCLADWLLSDGVAIRQHGAADVDPLTWCSLDLGEAHLQLSWMANALSQPLPALESWVCVAQGQSAHPTGSIPGWDFARLAASILRQCQAPIRLHQLQEAAQGVDVLWTCEQLRTAGAVRIGGRSAEVLGLSGAAWTVDAIPNLYSAEPTAESSLSPSSGLDVSVAHRQAYIAAEKLCTTFSLSTFITGDETPAAMARQLYRAAYRLPLQQQEGCLQELDQWWRQWF